MGKEVGKPVPHLPTYPRLSGPAQEKMGKEVSGRFPYLLPAKSPTISRNRGVNRKMGKIGTGKNKGCQVVYKHSAVPHFVGSACLVALVALTASPAAADPCEAKLPARGSTFAGVVRYVGDGDMLCVGPGADPLTWIEVRVADFYAPELSERDAAGRRIGQQARDALARLVLGKRAECVAQHRSWDRVVAVCTVGGQSVGDLMRRAGVREGGNR